MSMQYCEDCDRMIDTDSYEFKTEKVCMACFLNTTHNTPYTN